MRLDVPKIIREIRLSEYAEEFGSAAIQVWVNLPSGLMDELLECVSRKPEETDEAFLVKANRALEIYAEIMSQSGDADTHWTRDELIEIGEKDPTLWRWLRNQIWDAIIQHRKLEKKR